ncbi:hypothetical protein ABZ876_13820 [Streptomyces sp. NPDC046931]|uniref:hypothetical protein n=1 Tax=Streptomyces sp. NPDC046931 TaxID=3154806 RepID=UPI0034081BF2
MAVEPGSGGHPGRAQIGEEAIAPGPTRLAEDLAAGRRHTRHAELLTPDTMDVGYRLLVSDH